MFLWSVRIVGYSLAIAFVVGGAYQTIRQTRSYRWPSVSGRVLQSRYDEGSRADRDRVYLNYEYFVSGVRYECSQIAIGFPTYDGKGARGFYFRNQPGDFIKVYYDPQNPAFAVLRPGADEYPLSIALAVAFMLSFGLYMDTKHIR